MGEQSKIMEFSDSNILLSYSIATSAGQGGSGIVYKDEKNQFYVIGVHASAGPELNTGCWHTKAKFEEMRKWINYSRRKRQERILETRLEELNDKEMLRR